MLAFFKQFHTGDSFAATHWNPMMEHWIVAKATSITERAAWQALAALTLAN